MAGLIAGNGSLSGGKVQRCGTGCASRWTQRRRAEPLYVLDGFDYLLANGGDLGVRVVNCSFSANTLFDTNDPVNIATQDADGSRNQCRVFRWEQWSGRAHSNPYAAAPWVIGVGATDTEGRLASFPSRGDFGNPLLHPTLVAPGVGVVSVRGLGVANVTGAEGLLLGSDAQRLGLTELPNYTTANGTSFSAPQGRRRNRTDAGS